MAWAEPPRLAQFAGATGIRVTCARPGNGEIVIRNFARKAAGGSPQADVCTLTDHALGLHVRDKGWTADVDLPNGDPLSEQFAPPIRPPPPPTAPAGGFGLIIVASESLLDPADMPRTHADLIDPKHRDQVRFGAPEQPGSTIVLIKGLAEPHGRDFVDALSANGAAEMRLQGGAMQAVARGEKPLCVTARAWGCLYGQGAPRRLIFP